jgi:apolipoprotein N-acyltransferase
MGLVQHAEPPKDRWDPNEGPRILQRLWALSRQAEHDGARITVWPEAAYPFVVGHHAMRDGAEGPRVRGPGIRGEIITGLLTVAGHTASGGTDMFNAALIAHDGGSIDAPTAKMALLAFGEAVPFGEQVPWLRDTFARAGAMRPGAAPVVLTSSQSPVVVAGVLNCFEDTLPNQTRAVMAGRPNLLVNLTNDAWFGDSAEPELHLAAATMRAIESRRDMVRAVNTGVTAHLDALGQVAARANRGERTTLVVDVALLEGTTLFDRFGDASWLAPLLVASLAAAWRARRRSPDEA